MVQPRYNFIHVLGLFWLTPLLFIISILLLESIFLTWSFLFIFISIFIGSSFLLKQKWVCYLIGVVLLLGFLFASFLFINAFFNNTSVLKKFHILLFFFSTLTFIIGLFLLTFNIGTIIEFDRKRNQPINYTQALLHTQLNQQYFLKNTLDLTTCFGILLLTPCFFCLNILIDKSSSPLLHFNTLEYSILIFITFGSLLGAIGTFMKFKISRYLTVIVFLTIIISLFSEIETFLLKRVWAIGTPFMIGIIFAFAILALLFHPVTTHSFDKKTQSIKGYDDILDLE